MRRMRSRLPSATAFAETRRRSPSEPDTAGTTTSLRPLPPAIQHSVGTPQASSQSKKTENQQYPELLL